MNELHQCPECNGCGLLDYSGFGHYDTCDNCDGTGWLDEHGEPFYLEPELPEQHKEAQS
jgi:DnaJ-class molecular chaperone